MEAFKGYCLGCQDRDTCTELCPIAEEYADQDHVKHEELYLSQELIESMVDDNWISKLAEQIYLTRTEKKIVTLFGMGLERPDIRQVLNMTDFALRKHIERLRKKIRK